MRRSGVVLATVLSLCSASPAATAAVPVFGAMTRVDSGGDGTFGLLVTRLDGSGRDQVVAVNLASATVSVFTSDGRGSLALSSTAPTNTGPVYAAAFRPYLSGPPDLVVADNGAAKITYLNYLTGGMQVVGDQAVGANPNQIASGDFDGDGREEFAVANYGSSSISLFRSEFVGTPLTENGTLAVSGPAGLAAADVNGDRDLDLVVGATDGIYVALGQPGAGFAAPVMQAPSPGLNRDLDIADFNGDGDPDVVAAVDTVPGTRVFLGAGGAALSSPIAIGLNPAFGVGAADVNGDGLPDVLGADSFGQASVAENLGGGRFGPVLRDIATDKVSVSGFRDITAADLDGDGDLEVLIASPGPPGHVLIAENAAVPDAALSPVGLTFAAQPAGTIGPVSTVTVSNPTGGRPLHIAGTSVTAGDDFVIASDACAGSSVPRGGSCRIGIRSAPQAPGSTTASLRIVSDAPGGPLTVALSGSESAAPSGVAGPAGAAYARLVLARFDSRLRAAAGRSLTVRFATTLPAKLTLDVLAGAKRTRVARVNGRARRPGAGKITWNGEIKGRAAPPGSYALRLRAVTADGQVATTTVAATLTRRRSTVTNAR